MTTYVVSSLLFIVVMNVLATYSTEAGHFICHSLVAIMAIVARLIGSLYHVLGEVTDNTQMVWLSEQFSTDGLLALMFALLIVIPHSARRRCSLLRYLTPTWSCYLLLSYRSS